MENKILKIIQRIRESFDGSVEVYTQGSCIRFALILLEIYPQGKVLYNSDHAIFQLGSRYYDITGEVVRSNHIPIEEYGLSMLNDLLQLKYENKLCK